MPFWFSAGLAAVTLAITIFFIHPEKLGGKGEGQKGGGGAERKAKGKRVQAWEPPSDLPSGTRGENYEPIG